MTEPDAQRHADPWEAILADLTATGGERSTPPRPAKDTRPTPMIGRGHPFTALPDTIRCLKHRSIAHRRLYAVSFDSQQPFPAQWQWLIAAEEHEDGWVALGGAGGAGDGPERSDPWVNLAGWWDQDRFYAGGEILAGDNVKTVRLHTRDGVVLEDDSESGIVLFLADRTVEVPVALEMLDATGRVLATHAALGLPG